MRPFPALSTGNLQLGHPNGGTPALARGVVRPGASPCAPGPAGRSGVSLGVFRPGSGPFQESPASRGRRARAAEPAPSLIPPYASPSPPPQGRQACCYYLLSSSLLPSTSLRALLAPALAAPPGPAEGQRPAPPPQQGRQWAPRGQLRAGDCTGTFSPRQPQLPFRAERGSFSHLSVRHLQVSSCWESLNTGRDSFSPLNALWGWGKEALLGGIKIVKPRDPAVGSSA